MYRLIFLLLLSSLSYAQKNITGAITDKSNGEPLPSANIQIEGTLRGVVASVEGRYALRIESLPATIVVRYIGYESQKLVITENSPSEQNISLTPSSVQMEEMIVIGEDPGIRIMRNVIAKKKRWHKLINNFKADGYNRMVMENDSGIVMISESLADTYWDRDKGLKVVIKSKRMTKNVRPQDNIFVGEEGMVNFYDDDIEIQGSRFVGPTHPDALDYYDFKITGRRYLDDYLVYDIAVRSKTKLQPTFIGSISVIEEDSAMVAVDLKPTEHVIFPMPIQQWNVNYKQQFSNFGQAYWLPVDIRMHGNIKVAMPGLEFPKIIYSSLMGVNNYQINIELPDSLYKSRKSFFVDSVALAKPNQFDSSAIIIPRTEAEDSAFTNIKRGDSFTKAFKPKGALARYVKMEDDYNDSVDTEKKKKTAFQKFLSDLSPVVGFDRVEGGRLGVKYEHEFSKHWSAYIKGGYTTTLEKAFYGAGGEHRFGYRRRGHLEAEYYNGVDMRQNSENYNLLMTSGQPLFGYRDYFDYYKSHRFKVTGGYNFAFQDLDFSAGFHQDIQKSVSKTTDWDIIGRKYDQRKNPAIDKGTLRSFIFTGTWGEKYVPMGVVGNNGLTVSIEHSGKKILSSDFGFTTYKVSGNVRIKTFLRRRFIPNTLDVYATAGTYTGKLPVQRFGVIDGSLGYFTPFGTFKTLRTRGYEGEKYAAVFAEHNFRSLPFELIGLDWFARKNIGIAVFGSAGRTWIDKNRLAGLGYAPVYTTRWHQEVGASVNGLFGLFRIDAAQRLDKKNFYLGMSMARLF